MTNADTQPNSIEPADSPAATAWWPRLAVGLVRRLFVLLFKIRLEGQLPTAGPYLLVANHQGWSDAFLLLALLPITPRVYFIADRAAVMTQWWKRVMLRSLGVVITVDRAGRSERAAIDASLAILRRGAVVALFPEGRVSRAEGQIGSFRRGVGYLALRSGVPVVPVWLRGTAELYLGRELVARIGAPRAPTAAAPTHEETERLASQLRDDVVGLTQPWTERGVTVKHWRWLTDIL